MDNGVKKGLDGGSRRRFIILASIAAVLLVGLVTAVILLLLPRLGGNKRFSMPDVVGMDKEEAIDEIKSVLKNAMIKIEEDYSPTGKKGTVIRQKPISGSTIDENTTIRIWIYAGEGVSPIPTEPAKLTEPSYNTPSPTPISKITLTPTPTPSPSPTPINTDPVFDDTIRQYTSNGNLIVIEDIAGLLTDSERERLISHMIPVSEYGNVGFVTTDDNPDTSRSLAESWLADNLGTDSSVMLLIDMDNRMLIIQTNNGTVNTIGGILTKNIIDLILDDVYTYASDGDYFTCATKTFDKIASLMKNR